VNEVNPIFSKKYWFILLCFTLIKLWLVTGISLVGFGWADYDDRLFLNLASGFLKFLSGEQDKWLGTYNQLTLAKGPMYPLFIAISFISGLSLLMAQNILYIISGILLILVLREIIHSPFLLMIIYTIYIFNPEIEFRVMREGIYPALTILFFVGLIGCYVYRNENKQSILWAVFLGIILSIFWMTREEGILIIPSFIMIAGYLIFLAYKRFNFTKAFWGKSTIYLLLPLVILFGFIQLVSLVNKLHYESYAVVEFKSSSFLSAYGALLRVKHPHFKRYIPMPKDVQKTIYEISPSFKELEPFLEGTQRQHWEGISCQMCSDCCGDIGGGWFMWALRDAVAMAGYYTSGKIADTFYSKMAQEINTACKLELLQCYEERNTLIPPFREEYLPLFLKSLFQGINALISFKGTSQEINISSHSYGTTEESLDIFRYLTRENVAPLKPSYSEASSITLSGWAFTPAEKINLRIQSTNFQNINEVLPISLERIDSIDVYEYFLKNNHSLYENAKASRFNITSPCIKKCELVFYTQNTNLVLETINLENPDNRKRLNQDIPFYFYVDLITTPELLKYNSLIKQNNLGTIKINILQTIANFYYTVMPWLSYLGMGLYTLTMVYLLLSFHLNFLFVLNTAIFCAIIFRLSALSYIHITSFPTIIDPRYFASLYPLLIIFIILSIHTAYISWTEKHNMK